MSKESATRNIAVITGSREGMRLKQELNKVNSELKIFSNSAELLEQKALLVATIAFLKINLKELGVPLKD